MKLEQSFEVRADVGSVWATLIDVEGVARCLPGAEISGSDGEGSYRGTFSVKLGPATAAYNGTLTLERVDETSHTVVMQASGQDKRGQGSAKATIESRVSGGDYGSRVDVVTDFTITGRLARIGRGGMMEEVANRLLGDFARCLEARIGAGSGPSVPESRGADGDDPGTMLDAAAASATADPTSVSPEEGGSVAPAREPANARSAPAAPAGTSTAGGDPPAARPVRGLSLIASVAFGHLRARLAGMRALLGRRLRRRRV